MKMAIYGDSFSIGSEGINWYDHLAKMLNVSSYRTFGRPSTSTFYSFNIFKEEYYKYELNIFLITQWGRYTKKINLDSGNWENYAGSISFVDTILDTDKNLSLRDIKLLNDIRSWFMVADDEFLKTAQDLIINELRRICPNVILVPCFDHDNSMSYVKQKELNIKPSGNCMTFYRRQLEWFGVTEGPTMKAERPEGVGCHMTLDTNKIFANSLYNLIQNGTPIECPEKIPHERDFNFYFRET